MLTVQSTRQGLLVVFSISVLSFLTNKAPVLFILFIH